MEIKAILSIGYPTAKHTGIIEVDDNATDEDIDEEVQIWANNYIDIGWKKV